MLKSRVIPTLLFNSGGFCVKPRAFMRPGRNVGSMMQSIKVMETRNVDEIIIIDIDATKHGLPISFDKVNTYSKELFCPCTVGGGIKTLQDIERLLKCGADKVLIGFQAQNGYFLDQAAKKFGSQCISVAIDYREAVNGKSVVHYIPAVNNATEKLPYKVEDYAKFCQDYGAGEIVLTSVSRDATRIGYNHTVLKSVCNSVNIPVVSNGGCNGFDDMYKAFQSGAHAVAASSLFLFTPITPNHCSEYLANKGIQTRVSQCQI